MINDSIWRGQWQGVREEPSSLLALSHGEGQSRHTRPPACRDSSSAGGEPYKTHDVRHGWSISRGHSDSPWHIKKGATGYSRRAGDKGPGASLLSIPPGTTHCFKGVNPFPTPKDRPKVEEGPLVLLDIKWGTQNGQSLPVALGLMVTAWIPFPSLSTTVLQS